MSWRRGRHGGERRNGGEAPALERARRAGGPQRAERADARRAAPSPTTGSARDAVATLGRAIRAFNQRHLANVAAALAYYAFLAIPSTLMVAVGVFSLIAGEHAVSVVIDKLGTVAPGQAVDLVESSLRNVVHDKGAGATVLGVGGVLALWSLTGAMQNVMWAMNAAYGREDGRGVVRRRLTALWMVLFALLGFALAFGVLVLGPHLSTWIGDAVGARSIVSVAWWAAEWPLLVVGLLVAFAGLMRFGPDVPRPRWRLVTLGSVTAILLWLAASAAFAFYASRFGSYNKTWGSLSAVVVMLTWLWLTGAALLLGVEVDVEVQRRRELRREPAGDDAQTTR